MSNQKKKDIILIVDDHANNLAVLFDYLRHLGFKILVAESGQDAIDVIEIVMPDIILLDVMMPGMDGFETCSHLKLSPKTRHIPIIFMSALSETVDKVKGFKLGAVDYVTKPVQSEEVLARVNAHLALRKLQKDLELQNHRLQEEIRERKRVEAKLEKLNKKLLRLATLDGLTQVPNRRRFDEYLDLQWQQMSRHGQYLSLILCDIDYFKKYNDTYGHQQGDDCLQRVAKAISGGVKRPADLVARYGGEEFAVILPHTDASGAERVAEDIHLEIGRLKALHISSAVHEYVTLSIGIATTIPISQLSPEALIGVADQALYEAKRSGRNRSRFKNAVP
jgi:diguanylate cyclase (GGDEF)-like protein